MKTFITSLGILCLFVFAGCKSNNEKLIEKFIPIINNEMIAFCVSKVDSISIFKIDTISDSLYYQLRSNGLYHSIKPYIEKGKYYKSREDDLINQTNEAYNAAHMELNTPDETEFRQQQMDVYKQRLEDANNFRNEMMKYSDTLTLLQNEIATVDKIIKSKKLKNNNCLGYCAHFKLLAVDKNNSELKLDSLSICISPNFRIMHLDKI